MPRMARCWGVPRSSSVSPSHARTGPSTANRNSTPTPLRDHLFAWGNGWGVGAIPGNGSGGEAVAVGGQPGGEVLQLRVQCADVLRVADAGEVVRVFGVVEEHVRDVVGAGDRLGADVVQAGWAVGDVLAQFLAEPRRVLGAGQVLAGGVDRLAGEVGAGLEDAVGDAADVFRRDAGQGRGGHGQV